ncbi:MAG: hypothetical protein EOO69_02330 [Moraxellaceae bacterium]|nr:MAG: hypothetical protein EOO69_02330 [Moraxellaceae bacterium]
MSFFHVANGNDVESLLYKLLELRESFFISRFQTTDESDQTEARLSEFITKFIVPQRNAPNTFTLSDEEFIGIGSRANKSKEYTTYLAVNADMESNSYREILIELTKVYISKRRKFLFQNHKPLKSDGVLLQASQILDEMLREEFNDTSANAIGRHDQFKGNLIGLIGWDLQFQQKYCTADIHQKIFSVYDTLKIARISTASINKYITDVDSELQDLFLKNFST